MPIISVPKTRKGWAIAGGGVVAVGALFLAATSLMDDDNDAQRQAPAASSSATPPAPVNPPTPPAAPAAPVLPTTYYNIGERAGPVALFTTEDRASEIIGYVAGCYSTNDPEGELRGIKIVTPQGERAGFIDTRTLRPNAAVRDFNMTAVECAGAITAARDVPMTESFYRMAAGSNILLSPWEGSGITLNSDLSICLKVVDAVNNDHPDFAQVYYKSSDRRVPYTGWATYSSLVIDEHCRPQTP